MKLPNSEVAVATGLPIVVGLGVAVGLGMWGGDGVMRVYQGKLQIPFFSGFLTLGGFVLALKTNILLRLQKELFDSDAYTRRIRKAGRCNGELPARNRPLVNLGKYLILTVVACLLTAMLQVTAGFAKIPWVIAAACGACATSACFTAVSWFYIRRNLRIWFDLLEEQDQREIADFKAEQASATDALLVGALQTGGSEENEPERP